MAATHASGGVRPAVFSHAPLGRRGLGAAALAVLGLAAISELFGADGWTWLLAPAVGLIAGAVATSAIVVWPTLAAVAVYHAVAIAFGLPRDTGPFWYIAATGEAALVAGGFLVGVDVGWRRPPLVAAAAAWGAMRRWSRFGLVASIVLGMLTTMGYLGYAAWSGSAQFTDAAVTATDCRSPADRFGWAYEAINYDPAEDARLSIANADKSACTLLGAEAGTAVVTSDGIHLAGWYVPAASGVGPTGPTLLIVHGCKANKSSALDFAAPFHAGYNLVLFDLRNNGQSTGTQTSMGLREQRDVARMLEWVTAAKHPAWIGIVANSMGASAALGAAVDDQRVRALILDSVHADWATSVGNAMEEDFGYPGGAAGWAVIVGVSIRVGGDVSQVDPVRLIPRLGDRHVLLVQGTADQVDPPAEASDRNLRAGLAAGVPIEVAYCPDARHGLPVKACPADWAAWTTSFLARARASDRGW